MFSANKVITLSFSGDRLESMRSLFFSREEHLNAAKEAAQDREGWRKKLRERQAFVSGSLIKDPVLQQRVSDLLQFKGLEEATARGYYESTGLNALVVKLDVSAKAPSLIYRFFFDERIGTQVQIHCQRDGDLTTLRFQNTARSIFGIGGCLILIVAFGACIVPGVVALYVMNQIGGTWASMRDAIFEGVRETLEN